MKSSSRLKSSPSAPKTNRARILMALSCMGLAGAVGYELGQSSHNEPRAQLSPEGSAAPEKALNQCREAVARLSKRGKLSGGQLGQLRNQICQAPNAAQCVRVLDNVARDSAFALAGELDIVNLDDLDSLTKAIRGGFTEVDYITLDGGAICLKKPGADPTEIDSIDCTSLEEPIEDVPHKYLSESDKIPKSDDVLALEQQLTDGDADGIVRDFDLESIPPAAEENSSDAIMQGYLNDLQGELAKTNDPEARKDLFCQFIAATFRQEMSDDVMDEPESEVTPESVKRSRLMGLYMDALSKSVGVEDEDQCLSHIFSPSSCSCSEEAEN